MSTDTNNDAAEVKTNKQACFLLCGLQDKIFFSIKSVLMRLYYCICVWCDKLRVSWDVGAVLRSADDYTSPPLILRLL